jgi:DNA repair protein RadC
MHKPKPMKRFAYVTRHENYPYIGLHGPWLEQAGFLEGTTVKVRVDHNRLTITPKRSQTTLEHVIRAQPSKYTTDYRGYTVRLRLERDTDFKPIRILSPSDLYHFLKPLQYESREVSLSIALDTLNQVVSVYEVGKGSIHGVASDPAEVLKSALAANSTAIVLAHNHPNGIARPTFHDLNSTRGVVEAAERIGIQVLDHVIIGFNDYTSLKEEGFFER